MEIRYRLLKTNYLKGLLNDELHVLFLLLIIEFGFLNPLYYRYKLFANVLITVFVFKWAVLETNFASLDKNNRCYRNISQTNFAKVNALVFRQLMKDMLKSIRK